MKLYVSQNKIFGSCLSYCDEASAEEQIKLLQKNKTYKDFKNGPKYEISISDKNNLVLTVRNVSYYTSNEWFKMHVEQIKRSLQYIAPFETNTCRKAQLRRLFLEAKFERPSMIDDIVNISVKTRKLILTEDGRIYFMPKTNCLRRLSLKNERHIQLLIDFLNAFGTKNYISCFKQKKEFFENSAEVKKILIFYIKKLCKEANFIGEISPEVDFANFMFYLKNYIKFEKCLTTAPKFFKKMITNNNYWSGPMLIYSILSKNHFTTVEVIKLLFHVDDSFLQKSMKYFRFLKKAYVNSNVNVECIFANRICDGKQMEVTDAIRLFNFYQFLKSKYKDKALPELKKNFHKLSLVEAHNYLSAVVREALAIAEYNNYKYSDEVKSFSKEMDSYKFQLVRNSSELVEIAKIMSNCVAGYNQAIQTGRSIIIFGESKCENYPNLCIELSPAVKEKEEEKSLFDIICYDNYNYCGAAKRVVRQCYAPHNEHVRNNNVIETLKKYFSSINYHWASIVDREKAGLVDRDIWDF